MSFPRCPFHGRMVLEDLAVDGGETWLCTAWPYCREQARVGGVDEWLVWRREAPSLLAGSVRTVDEQFADGWRGM